ncbi:hypothetical protein BGZ68_004986 [Mortierella alpina]|nr:hypothetical protein BGZ68_004986 [Mortierella alpina]
MVPEPSTSSCMVDGIGEGITPNENGHERSVKYLYRELYSEEAIDDLDPARVEKHVSQLHGTLVQFGFECKGALRDMVTLYLKHVDAFGTENYPWLLYLIWIYILDDQVEGFPQNINNAFHTGVRYWYDGVKIHAYEHLRNSTNEVSMYLARVQTGGTIPLIILGLAFIEASFEKESTETDACVANKENIPDIVLQLKTIDKAVEATNTKYIGHPMIQCHKIFLCWHIVSQRYAPDKNKTVFG